MLGYYVKTIEALKCLGTDQDGMVSFEYVIVAACMVTAVVAAFGAGTASTITTALTNGMNAVLTIVATAVGS